MEAARLADEVGDAELKRGYQASIMYASYFAGRLQDALAVADRLLQLPPPEDVWLGSAVTGFSPYIWFVGFRGLLLAIMGHQAEGREEMERGLGLARQHRDMEACGFILGFFPWLGEVTGDTPGTLDSARQGVDVAERVGSAFSRVHAYHMLGLAQLLHGQWSEAVASFEQARAIARERGTALHAEATLLAHLAEALCGAGDSASARATAVQAIAIGRQRHTPVFELQAQLALARVLLRTAGAAEEDAIRTALAAALALVRSTGAASYEPLVRVALAELARHTGDEAARQRELGAAHRLFTELGAAGHAERVAQELGSRAESASPISSTCRT